MRALLSFQIVAKADKDNAVAKRSEDEKLAKERKEKQDKEDSEQKTNHEDESPLLDLNFGGEVPAPVTKAAEPSPAVVAPAPVAVAVPVPVEPNNDEKMQLMIERTKQPIDVCFFYLECADWNLENAVELLNSMQAISN